MENFLSATLLVALSCLWVDIISRVTHGLAWSTHVTYIGWLIHKIKLGSSICWHSSCSRRLGDVVKNWGTCHSEWVIVWRQNRYSWIVNIKQHPRIPAINCPWCSLDDWHGEIDIMPWEKDMPFRCHQRLLELIHWNTESIWLGLRLRSLLIGHVSMTLTCHNCVLTS